MVKDFIESGFGGSEINEAITQEKQLRYFTSSNVQDNYLTTNYINQWKSRKYETGDYFLNYVKNIFKEANFLTFFKYLRYPLPSAKIIQNKIIPDLKRVFWSENSVFRYDVDGVDTIEFLSDLKIDEFNKMVFEALMTEHNSILIVDLDDVNKPVRKLVNISDVVSIDVNPNDTINKIAFKAVVGNKRGYAYIDSEKYAFYDLDFNEISTEGHDLGITPAKFISPRPYSDKKIVRKSLYTFIREELEEYVFLKTLQKMTEPNGAIPVVTHLKSVGKEESKEPDIKNAMGSGLNSKESEITPHGEGVLQTGNVIKIPLFKKSDGSIDTDLVTNFIKFHYLPVESLNYIKNRIKEIERSLVTTLVGDVVNSEEIAKNPEQIAKSISVLENTLRELSLDLSNIRRSSDIMLLGLKYGIDRVNEVTTFYGSDFYLETEAMLYDYFDKAPSTIERKNILLKVAQTRYRDNSEQINRQMILYNLLPYCSDKDFEFAIANNGVTQEELKYQTRFNYWISQFEAKYGDIVTFYNAMNSLPDERYAEINNLIINLIQEDGINQNASV